MKFFKVLIFIGSVAALGLATFTAWGVSEPHKAAASRRASEPEYRVGEILVKFKPAFTTDIQAALKKQTGVQAATRDQALAGVHVFFHTQPVGPELFGWQRVRLPEGKSVKQAISELPGNALVESAEPNYLRHVHDAISTTYTAYAAPNDPYYQNGTLWWFNRIHADQALAQPNYFSSTPVIVAVVDTGTDLTHPDLAPRLVSGYNVITPTSSTQDDEGHGTHTSGLVAAVCNNSLGTAGAAFTDKVVVMPIKAAYYDGSVTSADSAAGIQQAADLGARVISMSYGGGNSSTAESAACAYAYAKGCVLVASAGNDGSNLKYYPIYPALYSNVICVAATNSQDYATYYSNYGTGKITLAAPGGCQDDFPGNTTIEGNDGGVTSTLMGNTWGPMAGTSMAAPQVSAAAAMLILQDPSRTQSQVLSLLTSHCENPQGQPVSWVGAGRINIAGSLAVFQTPTFSATPTISVTFTISPTITVSPTITPTPTISPTFTISPTITFSPTISPTFSVTPTTTCTPTATPSCTPTHTGTPLALGSAELIIYPQPGRDHVRLAYQLSGPGQLRAEVYNFRGERVLSLSESPYSNGGTAYSDLSTSQLAAGVYFLIARVEDQSGERKLIKRMAIIH